MNKSLVILVVTNFLAASASAAISPMTEPSTWNWVGSFSGGSVWANGGSTQTLHLTSDIEKSYVANQSNNTLFNGEIFLGAQQTLPQTLQGQFGIAVVATGNENLTGVIWDDADPQFGNYTYSYKIQHKHIAAKGKLLANADFWLVPWLSGSIGVGFNDAHGFNNTPTIPEAVPAPDFSSHTQTAFTYTVGAGVQKTLNEHWQVGVGYELVDWGKSNLGRASGQTLNGGLSLNHLYTNGLMFNLTYLS